MPNSPDPSPDRLAALEPQIADQRFQEQIKTLLEIGEASRE